MPNTTPVHGWETPSGGDKAGAGDDALASLATQIEESLTATYAAAATLHKNVLDFVPTAAAGTDIGDGDSHPLSGFYGSLGAAQADFPSAAALTDELAYHVIQKAIDNTPVGWVLDIRAGHYITNYALQHKQGIHVLGDGAGQTIIDNTYSGTNLYTRGPAYFFGSYIPAANVADETGYTIAAATQGESTVTTSTAADAGNLSAGDLVALCGTTASVVGGNPGLPNEMNRVVSANASTGVVVLAYPINSSLQSSSKIHLLNSGTVTAYDLTAKAMDRCSLVGVTLKSVLSGYQCLHLSCFESTVRDVHVLGSGRGLVTEAGGRSLIEDVRVEYSSNYGHQGAFTSHDLHFRRVKWKRTSGAGYSVFVQSGEGAILHTFEDCEVDDAAATSAVNESVLLGKRSRWLRGRIVGNDYGPIEVGALSSIEDAEIDAINGGHGISVYDAEPRALRNRVRNTQSGSAAIRIEAGTTDGLVADNVLGVDGARTDRDYVLDSSTARTTRKSGNLTYYSKNTIQQASATVVTGSTSEQTILEQTFAAGTLYLQQGWRLALNGRYGAGAGTKTVRVKLGTTTVTSFTPTGDWSIEGELYVLDASNFTYRFIINNAGTLAAATGMAVVAHATLTSVSVTAQLADAGHSLRWDYRSLTPIGGRDRA